MRKRIAILIFSLMLLKVGSSQELEGKYSFKYGTSVEDYLNFIGTKVEFCYHSEGGVLLATRGKGEFIIFHDYLVINVSTYYPDNEYFINRYKRASVSVDEVVAFRILFSDEDHLTLMILPSNSIGKIYTVSTLKELEKVAVEDNYRIRKFKK
jgi:hypothetical protein